MEKKFIPHKSNQEVFPLQDIVLQQHIQMGFKLLNMESYDGTSYPYEHIDLYRTIIHFNKPLMLCSIISFKLLLMDKLIHGFTPSLKELCSILNQIIIEDQQLLSRIHENEGETSKRVFKRFFDKSSLNFKSRSKATSRCFSRRHKT